MPRKSNILQHYWGQLEAQERKEVEKIVEIRSRNTMSKYLHHPDQLPIDKLERVVSFLNKKFDIGLLVMDLPRPVSDLVLSDHN